MQTIRDPRQARGWTQFALALKAYYQRLCDEQVAINAGLARVQRPAPAA